MYLYELDKFQFSPDFTLCDKLFPINVQNMSEV